MGIRKVSRDTDKGGAVSFVQRHAMSEAFKTLFREGMTLVEECANYLDGSGRVESRVLTSSATRAYAAESMRMTTRLMQIAAWLLLRRAVVEGEITPAQALSERRRVNLVWQELACDPDILAELPPTFVGLVERSLRMQSRIFHLDRSLSAPGTQVAPMSIVAANVARVEAAFRTL